MKLWQNIIGKQRRKFALLFQTEISSAKIKIDENNLREAKERDREK